MSSLSYAYTFPGAMQLSILSRHFWVLSRMHTTKKVMQPKQGRQNNLSCLCKPISNLRSSYFWHIIRLKKETDLEIEIPKYLFCSELFLSVWLAHFPLEIVYLAQTWKPSKYCLWEYKFRPRGSEIRFFISNIHIIRCHWVN